MKSRVFAALGGWALAGLLSTPVAAQSESVAGDATADDASAAKRPTTRFSQPIELTAGGKPLRGILYPSPTLHDSDRDGKRELWVGDLIGNVHVADAHADQDYGFAKLEKAKMRDGKLLKLQNW